MEGVKLCFPKLNTSCVKLERTHFDTVCTYILLSFMTLLTAALNMLVIISISHFRQLHTPTNLLLLSLAASDFFVSFLVFFQILLVEGCWFYGDLTCSLYSFFDYLITSTSVGNMVLISIDRYVAICDPLRYPSKVTHRRVQICICLCWMCSLFWNAGILRDGLKYPGRYNSCSGECLFVFGYVEQVADLIVTFIIPITLIMVLYAQVFVVAVSQARAMRSNITAVTKQRPKTVRAAKSELKAAKSLGVVVLVFLICLFPYYCVTLVGQDTLPNASSLAFVICLFYFNSCLNPLIYAFFYPWFRKSIKFIATLQILQPGSHDSIIL